MNQSSTAMHLRLATAFVAVLASTACTVTRVNDEVTLPVPERWENADLSARSISREDLAYWWTGFGDADLDEARVMIAGDGDRAPRRTELDRVDRQVDEDLL